jgi:hypothetical protein
MIARKRRLSDDEISVKLRLPPCGCGVHEVVAYRYVHAVRVGDVLLATQCASCKRVRLTYMADVRTFLISELADEPLYEQRSLRRYEQLQLF